MAESDRGAEDAVPDGALLDLLWAYDEQLVRGVGTENVENGLSSEAELDESTARRMMQTRGIMELLAWTGSMSGQAVDEPPSSGLVAKSASAPKRKGYPALLGRFQIVRSLGGGGLGLVFLAYDPVLKRHVALKLPRPEALLTAELRMRFDREAQAAARLTHPNIVPVYEVGQLELVSYIASAYCDGPSLSDWLRSHGPAEPRLAAEIVAALADALDYAHSQQVLHRDLKPANIVLEPKACDLGEPALFAYTPRVTDFGLAKLLDHEGSDTRTGALLGTPAYMAPEQADARLGRVGPGADVYGLGMILYELLTGKAAFRHSSDAETLRHVVATEPEPPRRTNRQVPLDLEAICLKCLEKQVVARYATAAGLARDLRHFLKGQPTQARPLSPLSKLAKWAQRKPTAAALWAVSLMSLALLMGLQYTHTRRLRQEVIATQEQRKHAEQERDRATARERESQDLIYAARISTAWDAWRQRNCRVMEETLNACREGDGLEHRRGFEWRYLYGLLHQERSLLQDHDGDVFCYAVSRDGQYLATGDVLGRIVVWNLTSNESRRVSPGIADPSPESRDQHRTCVNGLGFLADGRLVSASCDGTVRAWDWQGTGNELVLRSTRERANCLAVAGDGWLLAIGWDDGQVEILNANQPALSSVLVKVAERQIETVAFSPDDQELVVGGLDGHLQFLDTEKGTATRAPRPMGGIIFAAAYAPDGKQLAVGINHAPPRVIDLETGTDAVTLEGDVPSCRSIMFDPQGKTLVGSFTTQLRLWDRASGESRGDFWGHRNRIAAVGYLPDGSEMISVSWDRDVRLWSTATPRLRDRPSGVIRRATAITMGADLPDAPQAWCAAHVEGENCIEVRDWQTGELQQTLELRLPWMPDELRLSPTGRYLVAARGGAYQLFDITEQGALVRSGEGWPAIAFSDDERRVAVLEKEPDKRLLRLCELPSGRELAAWRDDVWQQDETTAIQFWPDTETLLITDSGGLGVWDCRLGAWERRTRSFKNSIARGAAGRELFALAVADQIHLMNRKMEIVRSMQQQRGSVIAMQWSPDYRTLVTAHEDGFVAFWHAATGMQLLDFSAHKFHLRQLVFSRDGTNLFTIGQRGNQPGEVNFDVLRWEAAWPKAARN
jgi:serine/threonine protein kinase/WD40 repeat protein